MVGLVWVRHMDFGLTCSQLHHGFQNPERIVSVVFFMAATRYSIILGDFHPNMSLNGKNTSHILPPLSNLPFQKAKAK
jgi:hypothetical protein